MSSKRDVSDEQNERHRKILLRVLKEDGNKQCADCHMRNPTWASVNLGVFVCLTCSGIHRSLGVHISQVRSTNLDTWLPRQVEYISCMGNVKANKYWEGQLPAEFRRPNGVSPNPELQAFIRNKYCEKRYAATDVQAPNIENYRSHPYITADNNKAAAPITAAAPNTHGRAPVTVPLPKVHPQAVEASSSLPPPPASAAPASAAVDLLGFDYEPTPPTAPAPTNAPSSAYDPFALLAASPPKAAPVSANDWNDFTSSTAVSSAAATSLQTPNTAVAPTPVAQPAAPAKPIDPFGNLSAGNIVGQMQDVSIHSQPKHDAKPKAAKSAVSPDDIMRLFDSQSGNGFSDNFFSSGPAPPTAGNHAPQPSAPLPAQHFSAPVMPSKGPALGMQMPMHPPVGGMPNGSHPGFGGPGMIPAFGGVSHGGFPQQQPFSMPQNNHIGGFSHGGAPQPATTYGAPSYTQPSLQQQAGLLNNPNAFAGLVSMQSPGFGGKKL